MVKQIERYPDYYVDEDGNVYSTKYGTMYKLKNLEASNGYHTVYLSNKATGIKRYECVHRLVAEAFVENTGNKPCVDHIDKNRANNKATNLRWVTYSENNRRNSLGQVELKHEPSFSTNKPLSNNSKRVLCYTLDGLLCGEYASASEAARAIGIKSISNIVKCCNGHRKTCADLLWKYSDK